MNMRVFYNRFYEDFMMPSRLSEFKSLLKLAISYDYEIVSIGYCWELMRSGKLCSDCRYLIIRHDIDTDIRTAKAMWAIEQDMGIKTSYFFRLSTIDVEFMQNINSSGAEASYHYEELSTAIKAFGLSTRGQIDNAMSYIRKLFRSNLARLREQTGLPMQVVASHGDWANRRTNTYNWELLTDQQFRSDLSIELEAYDDIFRKHIPLKITDSTHPTYWKPISLNAALSQKVSMIHALFHPRHWCSSPLENFIDDIKRLHEQHLYNKRSSASSLDSDMFSSG